MTPPSPRRPHALGRDEAIVVDDEVVVVRDHGIHRLNATAALVWERCDGETDLEAIAHRLAQEFDAPFTAVLADVENVVEELTSRELLAGAVGPSAIPMIEPPIQCTGCGDGPAFDARVLIAVDDGLLAIGADTEFAPELAAAFGGRALGVLDAGRTSYGVKLPVPASGPRHDVARLYRGPDLLARSRHPEPVVDALIAQIGAHAVPPGRVLLDAVAVGRDGRVVLVAPPANGVAFERMAARRGLAIAAGTAVVAGPEGVVTVGAPWLGVDRDALAGALRDRAHLGPAPLALAPGDHELVGFGASPPTIAAAFGALAPSITFGVGDGPLRLVHDLGASVPVVEADDLAAISRLTATEGA
jgi:hypothetical protein